MLIHNLRNVNPGEKLSSFWANGIIDTLREMQLQVGPGLKISRTPSGTTITLDHQKKAQPVQSPATEYQGYYKIKVVNEVDDEGEPKTTNGVYICYGRTWNGSTYTSSTSHFQINGVRFWHQCKKFPLPTEEGDRFYYIVFDLSDINDPTTELVTDDDESTWTEASGTQSIVVAIGTIHTTVVEDEETGDETISFEVHQELNSDNNDNRETWYAPDNPPEP